MTPNLELIGQQAMIAEIEQQRQYFLLRCVNMAGVIAVQAKRIEELEAKDVTPE